MPREEAEAYAKENDLLFFEISAKTGEGVIEVFTDIAKKIPLDQLLANNSRRGGAAAQAGAAQGGANASVNLNEGDNAAKKDACAC